MAEDIELRFRLVRGLMNMRYGDCIKIAKRDVLKAWAPTGDHDRSIEGAFRAMALSNGGHRPEESYTTEERIENDLDGSFRWDQNPEDGAYVFNRKLSSCPKCQGRGTFLQWPEPPTVFDPSAKIDMNEVVQVTTVKCDHKPQ